MSATHFLATDDPDLLRLWWGAVATGRSVATLKESFLPEPLPGGLPVVVVLDAAVEAKLPAGLEKCPTVYIGEPGSLPFEHARKAGRARVYLSYEESRTRLGEVLPLVEEIAERSAAVEVLAEKARRSSEGSRPPMKVSGAWCEASQVWEFLEAAAENIGAREPLLAEFRRGARQLLRASHILFFLPEGGSLKSDRGNFSCPTDDPLLGYLAKHPAILDGVEWPGPPDPMAEMAVRHRLMLWSAKLIVPVHDNGRITGLIALGVRDDGLPYDGADRTRLVSYARILRRFLQRTGEVDQIMRQQERWRSGEKYFPNLLILDPEELPPRELPLIVRTVAGEVKQSHETKRILPTVNQPYRVSAGVIAENDCIWVCWEDASLELRERNQRERLERLALLHDLALTLNHELGNSLVSLMALRHNPGAETNSPVLLAAIKRDIANLETVNRHLASIPTFREVDPEPSDLRGVLAEVCDKMDIPIVAGAQPVTLSVVPALIDFALQAIVESVIENRPVLGKNGLALHLRAAGDSEQPAALVTISGDKLELEGVLPLPEPGAIPSHGRIGVFIAKEIIRLHGGEIHAAPSVDGTEIQISVRGW